MLNIQEYQDSINIICRKYPIKKLDLFGSALTDKFDKHTSDIDLLVSYHNCDEETDYFDLYLNFKTEMEELFKKKIDLVVDKQFNNPVFSNSIKNGKRVIYER
ncbi:MAG: hypothetical protein A2Y40_09165 [Candidatus Margulisbacteria bacterium GWF2_35_9]|nr:MAG: hypothetical protein A2Y40_09165 [Candidatus Margulisbacteria bacterium GWF2_35_9]